MSSVTSITGYRRKDDPRSGRLRRLAIQLAAQLPEDEGEALEVLSLTETLVRSFLSDSRPV